MATSVNLLKRTFMAMLPPAVAGRLRGLHVRRLIAGFQPRVVEHRYGAGRLCVHLADPLAQGWYDHDWPELPEILALRGTTLREGARVFDIGAHQGVVALMLAREVGPSGLVVAVEPNPHNAATAVKNRELNRMTQVEIVEAAVSDRLGTIVFNEGLNGQLDDGSGAGGRMTVRSTTLDELADRFGRPDVVVVDVEARNAWCCRRDSAFWLLEWISSWKFMSTRVWKSLEARWTLFCHIFRKLDSQSSFAP